MTQNAPLPSSRPIVQPARGFLHSLSGRFVLLTVIFVLIANVVIFVPSMARFREDYLQLHLEKAQIASLARLASDTEISADLELELLENAGVFNVVLRRDQARQLVLSSPVGNEIAATYDLRDASEGELMRDALVALLIRDDYPIRVIGDPVRAAGLSIEITLAAAPLREAMIAYALRILLMSAALSGLIAVLFFGAVRKLLLMPIRGVISDMAAYAEAPQDARRIIEPHSSLRELQEAELALQSVQTQLTGALRQKERLAQLGAAVAKISHDLRNILTTAQLFVDRIGASSDPAVARIAPKLVGSIARAVSLCESTLAFGKAEEPPPRLSRFPLRPLVDEIVEAEALAPREGLTVLVDIPAALTLRADREQLYRVLANLMRNAMQAIEATGEAGTIEVSASEADSEWLIRVGDTGPGLPARAREHLFTAFQGGARKGGSGLGLAIAAELVRGHGGQLELVRSDESGSEFALHLPRNVVFAASEGALS